MPKTIEDYCHRIGRTGRAGAEGTATSLLTNDDSEIMYDLKKMLLATNNHCPPELMNHEAALRDPKSMFLTNDMSKNGKKITLLKEK